MEALSLVFLVGAILIGVILKVNIGIVAIGSSLILGTMAGMSAGAIRGGFPTTLFVTLLGVMVLFGIATENKTLALLCQRILYLAGNRVYLIPFVIFFFSAALAAIGPGAIPVMSLMSVFACSLAAEMKVSPVVLATAVMLGACGGGLTPVAPTGIIGLTLAYEAGITGIEMAYAINSIVALFISFVILYFALGGYKMKSEMDLTAVELPSFDRNQIFTMIGILIMVVLVIGFGYDVGLTAFAIAAVLLFLRTANEKEVLATVSWSTLVLICGVQVLMSMTFSLGGIDLMARGLATIMTPATAPGILAVSAGIMSWFASTSGVVMPTLIPTIPAIMAEVGGSVTYTSMISAVTNTAHSAAMSPFSTGGALGISAYSQIAKPAPEEHSKLLIRMFLTSAASVAIVSAIAFLGLYNILAPI